MSLRRLYKLQGKVDRAFKFIPDLSKRSFQNYQTQKYSYVPETEDPLEIITSPNSALILTVQMHQRPLVCDFKTSSNEWSWNEIRVGSVKFLIVPFQDSIGRLSPPLWPSTTNSTYLVARHTKPQCSRDQTEDWLRETLPGHPRLRIPIYLLVCYEERRVIPHSVTKGQTRKWSCRSIYLS